MDMANVWGRSLLTFIGFTATFYVVYSVITGIVDWQVLLTSAIAGVLFVAFTAVYVAMQRRKK